MPLVLVIDMRQWRIVKLPFKRVSAGKTQSSGSGLYEVMVWAKHPHQKLAKARENSGLDFFEAADFLGLRPVDIADIEHGRSAFHRDADLKRAMNILSSHRRAKPKVRRRSAKKYIEHRA